jgi:putative lipoprotein
VIIEVRDVSVADAPSTMIAARRLRRVALRPGRRIPFALEVPEVAASQSLSVRVHVDVDGDGRMGPGDLLSTRAYPVAATGPLGMLQIAVVKI